MGVFARSIFVAMRTLIKAIRRDEINRILLAFLCAVSLCSWNTSANANGLPKAEEGWAYYCSGERIDSYYESPNAIIILKLRKEDVRRDKKAMLFCETDVVDERFIVESLFLPGDNRIEGAVAFKFPVSIAGKTYQLEMISGSGPMANYQQQDKMEDFKLEKKICGMASDVNDLGLFVAEYDKKKMGCNQIPFIAYGFLGSEDDHVQISCFSDQKCLYYFFYRNWKIYVRQVPRSLLPQWRNLHKQFLTAIEDRAVFYLAPDGCFGPLSCDDLSKLVHVKAKS